MRHIPHVFVARPWESATLPLADDAHLHLGKVLRRQPGDSVTYTDGGGTIGSGTITADGITRGREEESPEPLNTITVAVAPPHSADRVRFTVEKLGEIGVYRLVWLDTAHGAGRVPAAAKALAWSIAALQQSQGDRLLNISGPTSPAGPWADEAAIFVAERAGRPVSTLGEATRPETVILVGPEGGFAKGEVPVSAVPISLGPRVLRVETAAVVAAAFAVRLV